MANYKINLQRSWLPWFHCLAQAYSTDHPGCLGDYCLGSCKRKENKYRQVTLIGVKGEKYRRAQNKFGVESEPSVASPDRCRLASFFFLPMPHLGAFSHVRKSIANHLSEVLSRPSSQKQLLLPIILPAWNCNQPSLTLFGITYFAFFASLQFTNCFCCARSLNLNRSVLPTSYLKKIRLVSKIKLLRTEYY